MKRDDDKVEGGVAEAEHIGHPPHQQGQIRRPLVYAKDILPRPHWIYAVCWFDMADRTHFQEQILLFRNLRNH